MKRLLDHPMKDACETSKASRHFLEAHTYVYIYIYIHVSLTLSLSLYIYIERELCVYIYIYIYIYTCIAPGRHALLIAQVLSKDDCKQEV